MRTPQEAYAPTQHSALSISTDFYDRLAGPAGHVNVVSDVVVPIRSGYAWKVMAGQVCRMTAIEGAQVADFNAWNLHNPRERFWAARTRQLQRAHVSVYDRLWSTLPYLRPMLTIVGDSLADYGTVRD